LSRTWRGAAAAYEYHPALPVRMGYYLSRSQMAYIPLSQRQV